MRVTDPVCEMTIDSETAAGREIWLGQTYYFCSKLCQHKFRATPDWYVRKADHSGGRTSSTGSA
jgi:Cu+-exporting ATPase